MAGNNVAGELVAVADFRHQRNLDPNASKEFRSFLRILLAGHLPARQKWRISATSGDANASNCPAHTRPRTAPSLPLWPLPLTFLGRGGQCNARGGGTPLSKLENRLDVRMQFVRQVFTRD